MSTPPNPSPPPAGGGAPQKDSSNIWAWVLGLVAAGIVILGTGAFIVTRFLVRSIEVNRAGTSVEINTPAGTLRAANDASVDVGLPVYPGAKVSEAAGTVEITAPEEDSVHLTAAHYRTIDPIEKVDAWYQEKLGPDFKREGPGVMKRKKDISGILVKSSDIAYILEKDDVVLVVALEKKLNSVEISLLRAGKPETQ